MTDRLFNQAQVRKLGAGFLVFAEFELFTVSGVNVAPLGTATSTSTDFNGPPENAIDGSSETSINLNTVFHSASGVDETWTLTLDREYLQSELASVHLLARDVGSNHENAVIELLSSDGQAPLLVGTTVNVGSQTFVVQRNVQWVLNANSKYEISSRYHLLQLMNNGTLYSDTGTPPADYWDSDYEQTVDIDFGGNWRDITPIGDDADRFTGSYDGNGYAISNWSLSGTTNLNGLFGRAQNATFENIKLEGVWSMVVPASSYAGFLVGNAESITARNIEGSFDEGSTISCSANPTYLGGLFGFSSGNVFGLTVKGNITLDYSSGASYCGGISGRSYGTNFTGVRNVAIWPNAIKGSYAGGIAGQLTNGSVKYVLNAMIGDVTGGQHGGGVAGDGNIFNGNVWTQVVNSMRGNINGGAQAGGIFGYSDNDSVSLDWTDVINYMTGDIICTNSPGGGMIGKSKGFGSKIVLMANCINAMNGTVDDGSIGTLDGGFSGTLKIDTSFGLTYSSNTRGSETDPFTGTTNPLIPELSYTPLVFTDNATSPNSYEFQMVFGNLGGHSSYSQYTHAIISKNDVAGPISVDFDLPTDVAEFVTYLSVGFNVEAWTDSLTVLGSKADVVYAYDGTTVLFGEVPEPPSPVSDGAVLYVNSLIPASYTPGAGAMNDLTLSPVTLDSNLGSTTVTEGGLDFSSKTDYLTPSQALTFQTVSLWAKKTNKGSNLLDFRDAYTDSYTYYHIMSGYFFSDATVYIDGEQATWNEWQNPNSFSTFRNLVFVGTVAAVTQFKLFLDDGNLFRSLLIYDRALTAQEVLQNYRVFSFVPDIAFPIEPFSVTPRVTRAIVTVLPLPGATSFRLTSQRTGSQQVIIRRDNFTELVQNINNLSPDTEYTFKLYSSGSLVHETVFSTKANTASNYEVSEFLGDSGRFDLTALGSKDVSTLSNVMNDLFTTGDAIDLNVGGGKVTKSKFINRGANVSIDNADALVAPFTTDAGSGQAVSLTLSDSSVVSVDFDETTEAITVGADSYTAGESFVLDGKKTTIVDI